MRLFTGIELPVEVKGNLETLLSRLRPAARVKWSPVNNLHITTKFIGEWPADRLTPLVEALRRIPGQPPFRVALTGLGWFPNPHSPRIFWVGVEAGPVLTRLARDTDQALADLSIPEETRPFSPHLTLARVKEPVPLDRLRQAVAALPSDRFGDFAADRFHLYLSERGPSGSLYTKLESFALTS